ncbi:hypothetical protein JQ628_26630 [Bradyrhizobium lablabi]|uniref:hypothetical protein n=1 Tax=Bradyrhizobium lablabi TaxID=722472 RepID=UPI001BA6A404|nr:hypothetical protein [Bradyrhizobium lablabi]MBR1125124.1 hypothetical protein [Bradyrhizobium lablabi]
MTDKDSLVSGRDADASRSDSQDTEPGLRQLVVDNERCMHRSGNFELRRRARPSHIAIIRDETGVHRRRRSLARPLREQRTHHRAVHDLRTDHPAEVRVDGALQASHPEARERGFAARNLPRAVQALRSPYLTNIGVFVLLCAISFHPCFNLSDIISRSFLCLGAKAAFVATVDLVVNDWTPTIQAFLAGRLARWIGLSLLLALLPALTVIRAGMLSRLRSLAAIALVWLRGAGKSLSQKSTPGQR